MTDEPTPHRFLTMEQVAEDYIAEAYRRTAERIAAGDHVDGIPDGEEA